METCGKTVRGEEREGERRRRRRRGGEEERREKVEEKWKWAGRR